MFTAVHVTSWLWLLLEISLVIRDRVRGTGSARADRGTRRLVVVLTLSATLAATVFEFLLPAGSALRFSALGLPGWEQIAGVVAMGAGLVLRGWSVVVLGKAFRTTVEVGRDQPVVTRGPYRRVRHPSYTGVLLLAAGYGLAAGNWLSFALTVVLPLVSVLVRIAVEERALVRVLGRPYETYRAGTKRLVPGLW
ncbi:methyltransferase family protein [Amycolatopsis jiangsuensis]|uniref:Protein-S-isoprenylcysteine O-methyltransferase Ste14 n=1 Tax=Amycolatopsis jiangsuensis TaxID=1181879 RepID=A0A840J6B3_9PSEU|nr:isoprenylcysteine carboxylmethyltransferase family protein [Amycolatopsis jiangsuensis]MBB4689239.1 protein-S-isoprenylcysteine O-methyltransferase Ste14 [Amycolatopsis jiangsuensis]